MERNIIITETQVSSLVSGQRLENLGNTITLSPGFAQPQTVLQVDVKETYTATEMITIWLRAERAGFEAPDIGVAPPIAEIEFGAGSSRAGFLEVDVPFQGCVLSVPCSSLRVNARIRPGFIGLDAVSVSVFLSRGTRSGSCGCPPRRTITVGPTFGAVLQIPRGVVAMTYYSQIALSVIRWLDWSGTAIGGWNQSGSASPATVPIPSDAQAVQFSGLAYGSAVFGAAA